MRAKNDRAIMESRQQEMNKENQEFYNQSYPLAYTWVYWIHSADSDDWSDESFTKVFSFSTIEDFWRLFNNIKCVTNGLHFLMREGVSPCWTNPVNSHLWWIKRTNLSYNEAYNVWLDLSMHVIGDMLFKTGEENGDSVNGISVSYKNGDYVFKILINKKIDNPELYNSIELGEFTFDFISGGCFIENTGGKKNYGNRSCRNSIKRSNNRQPNTLKIKN